MPGRTPKRLDREQLLIYAARALSARALSISELRNKLRQRAASAADVDGVLARLKESGYLNDRRFADAFATARRDNQGFGKMRVLRDLLARRVAPAVARQAANAAYGGADEVALIESFLARKYRKQDLATLLAEDRHLASAYRKLRNAGFSVGNCVKVLKRYAARAEDLEETEDAG